MLILIKIGRNVNGQVEQLLMIGVKEKSPADQQYSYWLLSNESEGYEPDSSLTVQCVGM